MTAWAFATDVSIGEELICFWVVELFGRLLDELARGGRLKRGDKILMSAFGAGFTTGACIIEWTK